MSDEGDEFGISCRRWMPLAWRGEQGKTPPQERTAWLNHVNEKRLQTILERETRERPSADIAHIESLLIEVLHCVKQPPASRSVLLAGRSVEWIDTSPRLQARAGDRGLVSLCFDPELPYAVDFSAELREVDSHERGKRIHADLRGLSEQVVELYQQLIFIYNRRSQRESTSA